MPPDRPTHILFDFFGTLVAYVDSRTAQGFDGSYRMLRQLGAELSQREFLDTWAATWAAFDDTGDSTGTEFAMTDIGTAYLAEVLGRQPAHADVVTFTDRYVAEWNAGVRHLDGVADLVLGLGQRYRLAVVSNTHRTDLIPDHLRAMGLLSAFDAVVASIEVGWRKPHPKIYSVAMETLGITAADAVFVGDTFGPDYLGPERAGIRSYLIDPGRVAPVPPGRRLGSIFDLPVVLAADLAG